VQKGGTVSQGMSEAFSTGSHPSIRPSQARSKPVRAQEDAAGKKSQVTMVQRRVM